jgi:hypothetical protein
MITKGATTAGIADAFGWLPHTTRAEPVLSAARCAKNQAPERSSDHFCRCARPIHQTHGMKPAIHRRGSWRAARVHHWRKRTRATDDRLVRASLLISRQNFAGVVHKFRVGFEARKPRIIFRVLALAPEIENCRPLAIAQRALDEERIAARQRRDQQVAAPFYRAPNRRKAFDGFQPEQF